MKINDNEKVIATVERSKVMFAGVAVGAIILGLPCLALLPPIGLILIVVPIIEYLHYKKDTVILTDRNIHVSIGIVSKNTSTIPLRRINNIGFQQTMWGRMFNYGTIDFSSIGGAKVKWVKSPADFVAKIENAIGNA